VQLDSGDTLVILTDGILEAECTDGSFFGVNRTLDVIRDNRHESASDIVHALFARVLECRRGAELEDDVTAVIVKVL
jgi:sigma-B regulation protein RsbU (phosphoserine phosphatase)